MIGGRGCRTRPHNCSRGGAASDRTHIKDRDPPPGYDAMMMLLPEDGGKLSPPLWITDVAPPPAYAAAIQMGGNPLQVSHTAKNNTHNPRLAVVMVVHL